MAIRIIFVGIRKQIVGDLTLSENGQN